MTQLRAHKGIGRPADVVKTMIAIVNRATAELTTGIDTDESNNSAEVEAEALCVPYEYAAKFVCGEQTDFDGPPLTRGVYATTVNVHNPNDERVRFFKKLSVTYPPAAQRSGTTGQVVVSFTANSDGSVSDINIVSAKPRGVFERSVQAAVRRWRFQPIAGTQQVTRTFDFQ